jgi:hypothetical protein
LAGISEVGPISVFPLSYLYYLKKKNEKNPAGGTAGFDLLGQSIYIRLGENLLG